MTQNSSHAQGLNTGWTVVSYLFAGMIAYGAIGWLAGRATHVALLFPAGMVVGLAISLIYIVYRFGRQPATSTGDDPPELPGRSTVDR